MFRILVLWITLIGFMTPAAAGTNPGTVTADAALVWISRYRTKPDVARVPAVVRALSQLGALKDPESSGTYVGFVAGIIGSNPSRAEKLVSQMLPLPFEDQWVIIRAIAYSGLPTWKDLLRRTAARLPQRQKLVEMYLTDKLLPLYSVALEGRNPTALETMRSVVTLEKLRGKTPVRREETFASSPELLDTLWGIYFATGDARPIAQMIRLLPWSKEKDSVDKLTVGSMAKFTMATNASRDASLLDILRRSSASQPKEITPILAEVIDAAETVDTVRVRKEALAAIEQLKRKGPGYKQDLAWWGQLGEGAISAGCMVAAVAGQVALGLPCVVGGALSTGAVHYLSGPS
jgi:hypothetical protein